MEKNNLSEKETKILESENEMMKNLFDEIKERSDDTNLKNLEKNLKLTKSGLLFKAPMIYSATMVNMFTVEFPKEFGIESYTIETITMPKLVGCKWEDTTIIFKQLISPTISDISLYKRLINKKNFDIILNILDNTGVPIMKWKISVKKPIYYDFGGIFSYLNNEIGKTEISYKTKKCVLI